jgi:hypothetical protein
MNALDIRQFRHAVAAKCGRKKETRMAAMRMLHCTIATNRLYLPWEDQQESPKMGFLTEMFCRPRPKEQARYRSALAVLHAMSNADRADIGVKPADFPRIAREMAMR